MSEKLPSIDDFYEELPSVDEIITEEKLPSVDEVIIENKLPENTNYIYVIDRKNEYIGSVKLVDLFNEDTEIPIEKIMDIQVGAISASSSAEQVISTFQNLDLISLPVVDDKNILLGEITVDDVVDAIQDQANSEIFNMAGLDDEDDIFAPIFVSSRR